MQGFPDIINTDIVPAEWNAMWNENEVLKNFLPKPILIFTTPYKIDTAESIQLQKMLDACKLSKEQYNLIIVNENQIVSINNLQNDFNLKTILLLGVLPSQLGISAQFALNKPNNFNNCIFIPALSLSEMEEQPQMKGRLWNDALKPLFIENK